MSTDNPAKPLQDSDKGINPDRSPEFQAMHGKMVALLASQLAASGYIVKADHIFWTDGRPDEINGFIPDITATRDAATIVFEVETFDTFATAHTRSQLTAFCRSYPTCVIVPANQGQDYENTVISARRILFNWDLSGIGVGTCDLATDTVNIQG